MDIHAEKRNKIKITIKLLLGLNINKLNLTDFKAFYGLADTLDRVTESIMSWEKGGDRNIIRRGNERINFNQGIETKEEEKGQTTGRVKEESSDNNAETKSHVLSCEKDDIHKDSTCYCLSLYILQRGRSSQKRTWVTTTTYWFLQVIDISLVIKLQNNLILYMGL